METPADTHPERRQLDLFLDGRDAFLVHAVTSRLVARDRDRAETDLERLRDEHRMHPDLPALALLVAALSPPPSPPATHAMVTAAVEELQQRLAPAARRLLGEEAAAFLQPLWQALAAKAAGLPFDAAHPFAHGSWLCQQYGDWAAVRAAAEAEPDWPASACLRHRLGLARYHLGEADAAIRLWLPLCWVDPVLFARLAPTLPSTILREGWEAFERVAPFEDSPVEPGEGTAWFPAWLLLRQRGLAHLFRADEIPDTGPAARVFRHLLGLLPLEPQGLSGGVIAGRRALRLLSPDFFHVYMETVARRGPRG